jgi:hypothetical protein
LKIKQRIKFDYINLINYREIDDLFPKIGRKNIFKLQKEKPWLEIPQKQILDFI